MTKAIGTFIVALAVAIAVSTASAQKKEKPWTDWSKKEVENMLDDSPWGQTQTETDSAQGLFSRTANPNQVADPGAAARLSRGAVDKEVNIQFRVRFFSARPIRQALARRMELDRNASPEVMEKLRGFAEMKSAKSIIVTVSFDSNDKGYLGSIIQTFNGGTTNVLKNNSYLERGDGKRLTLEQYVPPGKDGFGARFIFLREMDGLPFLNPDTGSVRFHAEYPNGLTIDRRFKVAQMMYKGELEY